MISFIIPCYNAEKTIIFLLDSITSTMYIPYEVICVDDGSTDQTSEIILRYAESHSRIRLINQKNSGPSAARNAGIIEAKGDWIMFADSDDTYCTEGLVRLQKEVENNPNAELHVFQYKEVKLSKETKVGSNSDESIPVKTFLVKEYEKNEYLYIHSCWNKVYRKENILFEFMNDIKLGEDAIFNAHYMANIKEVNICGTVLYNYKWGGQSLSHSDKSCKEVWEAYLMIYMSISCMLKKFGLMEISAIVFKRYYIGTINEYIKKKNITKDDKQTLKCMLTNARWISQIEIDGNDSAFERLLILFLQHGIYIAALWLCDVQRWRRKRLINKENI